MSIYLDYHATTPCDPRVVEAMLPIFSEGFGNPSSVVHKTGQQAAHKVEFARQEVAALIGAEPKEVIFTSGATESNNLAITGVVMGNFLQRRVVVTTPLEHKSILETTKETTNLGFEVRYLPVNNEGLVNLDTAREIIDQNTLIVSVQAASNEIGTIQNVRTIADFAHEVGALFHTDAAQAVGKIPVSVIEWDVDLLSISGHKLYGPKGVGALYMRGGPYSLPIKPIIRGGGQEWGLRAGTLNVPGIVGLGMACTICRESLDNEARHIEILRNEFEDIISQAIPEIKINGAINQRLPGNSNITLPNVDAEVLIANLPDINLSTGSACTTGALEPSHVLTAIGLSRELAYHTFRVGIGRFTTREEIIDAAESIINSFKFITNLY